MAYYQPAYAQKLPQNLSTVNVDNLTDDEIRGYMQEAKSSGLTDSQLIQAAQSKGMPEGQIKKLQARIALLNTPTSAVAPAAAAARELVSASDGVNNTQRTSQIFGAKLFRSTNTTFEPNLKIATPVNYILGPDDQLAINISGNSLANWILPVTLEGNINLPGIGLLKVAGQTIEQATARIKSVLAAHRYAIDNGTTVSVTLGNIRSIRVIMTGEIMRPATYTLSSLGTVFNALYLAGGPNDNGSFREIEVIRDSKIIKLLDVYDFLLKPEQKSNITLQDQDIIRVPTYRTHVEMSGEVKTPAIFETLPGETLQDVIRFAGGFTDIAYAGRIKVTQIADQQRRIVDIPESDYKNYIPLRGDKYHVDGILDRYENRVTITGAVFRPGPYPIKGVLTISQLIQQAAGLKEDAFSGRGSITRLRADNTTEIVPFNLQGIMDKSIADIPLQREDIVNISSIFDLQDKYTVTINGEVRGQGSYPYADNLSIEDLIIKAGGFTQGASAKRIEVARRTFDSDPLAKDPKVGTVFTVDVDAGFKPGQGDFKLKPFDIVSVYSIPGFQTQKSVTIEGEVLYAGPYTLIKKNERISDLINRAGGLTTTASPEDATLKRTNLAVLGVNNKITDATTIINDRQTRVDRVKQITKDSSQTLDQRNDYVGINLKKILSNPGSTDDLILEEGDILRIPKKVQTVMVNGQVLYPSVVVYNPQSLHNFVLNAGGYAPDALKSKTYVVYPNGTVKGTKKFLFFNNYPAIKPGSEIIVPKKPATHAMSTAETVAISTSIASFGAILLGIVSLIK